MAPIRRYLRISKNSVLECRIFLENPADAQRWLLSPSNPALPRVIAAVKPMVLPKLREENERIKGKGKKRRVVKDVVKGDDFDISIFMTELGTRHFILTKSKTIEETGKAKTRSAVSQGHADHPIAVPEDMDEDDSISMDKIPQADPDDGSGATIEVDSSEDGNSGPRQEDEAITEEHDDKKKLGFQTTYEGFSIWGFVLCLFVTRRGDHGRKTAGEQAAGQALMEEWIAFTQRQQDDDD